MNNSEQDTSNGDSPFKKIFETDWFAIPNFIFEVFDERVSSYHIQLFTLFELENDEENEEFLRF